MEYKIHVRDQASGDWHFVSKYGSIKTDEELYNKSLFKKEKKILFLKWKGNSFSAEKYNELLTDYRKENAEAKTKAISEAIELHKKGQETIVTLRASVPLDMWFDGIRFDERTVDNIFTNNIWKDGKWLINEFPTY